MVKLLFLISVPGMVLIAVVLGSMSLRRDRPARGVVGAAWVLGIFAIATVLYALGGDDDTSNHASRWAIHPAAHLPIVLAVAGEAAAAATYLAARRQAALAWLGVALSFVATGASFWSFVETSH